MEKFVLEGLVMGERATTYRELIVWQRGMDLARAVYRETQLMPAAERFGLTSQMRRAVTSVPMNIAEGFGKMTRRELLHGLRVARGSLFEVMTAYELVVTLEMLKPSEEVLSLMSEVDRLNRSLMLSLERTIAREQKRVGTK